MNRGPIEPAVLDIDPAGRAYSPRYGDIYHPQVGALAQARHVFLGGNGLPHRWRGRERWVVLETGFGLGNNFLATWQAWREDPARCERLQFISIEQHPLRRADLARVARDPELASLAQALVADWPPLTANLHLLSFESGRVQLLLALGDVQHWLPQLVAAVDAIYLDGFAPATNPRMWDERVCKALGRLAIRGTTAATWSAARALRAGLTTAGFQVRAAPGIAGKRDITTAVYAPTYTPRSRTRRTAAASDAERHAVVVGAGLAGCAVAWALAAQGWRSTVLEAGPRVAGGASGNPAGLFHGIVNAEDGLHARFNRAAALQARAAVRVAHAQHGVAAGLDGLLRLETAQTPPQMRATLHRLGLPQDYVEALDADQASARAGIALAWPAWWYPGGGWVDPAGLARSWLAGAGAATELRLGTSVDALAHDGVRWSVLDAQGRCIVRSATVVLANARDALRLLGAPDWPIQSLRGQLSLADATVAAALPRVPVAGAGYLLPAVGATMVFGATRQTDDADPTVRRLDHLHNLSQLERLTGRPSGLSADRLAGRTGFRSLSHDRLPIVGAAPEIGSPHIGPPGTARPVARAPGLFVLSALGSRGITWSALCAQVLAATISGAPVILEADLIDAIDPARFAIRRQRRAAAGRV